jgi:hypothetical protein
MAKIKEAIEDFRPDPRTVDERGPTRERLSKLRGEHDTAATGALRMRDPLERILRKKLIEPYHYNAGTKFRHHWYHSGFAPHVGSMDLNKVFSVASGGGAAERQIFHRQQYAKACERVGMRTEKILADVICWERDLDEIGKAQLGISNRPQAEAAVKALFVNGLDMLVELWGLRTK